MNSDSGSLSSQKQASNLFENSEPESTDFDNEIHDYVQKFKLEVEGKYNASKVNRDFAFPRAKPTTFLKSSFDSLEGVQFYDLQSQNVRRKVKELESRAKVTDAEVLAETVAKIGRLDVRYLQSQLKTVSSPLFKMLFSKLNEKLQKEKRNPGEGYGNEYGEYRMPIGKAVMGKTNSSVVLNAKIENLLKDKQITTKNGSKERLPTKDSQRLGVSVTRPKEHREMTSFREQSKVLVKRLQVVKLNDSSRNHSVNQSYHSRDVSRAFLGSVALSPQPKVPATEAIKKESKGNRNALLQYLKTNNVQLTGGTQMAVIPNLKSNRSSSNSRSRMLVSLASNKNISSCNQGSMNSKNGASFAKNKLNSGIYNRSPANQKFYDYGDLTVPVPLKEISSNMSSDYQQTHSKLTKRITDHIDTTRNHLAAALCSSRRILKRAM